MGAKFRAKVGESLAVAKLRKEIAQAITDRDGQIGGYLEHLGTTLGSVMVVQEQILNLLEERQPGTQERVKALVEEARAKFKAEQEAKAKAAEEAAAKAKAEQAEPAQETPSAEAETVH